MVSTTSSSTAILEVKGLCKHYPVFSKKFFSKQIAAIRASDDVSFVLRRGETLGLVGESGSGKTTTARAILRAITPTAGDVLFHSSSGGTVDLAKLSARQLKPLRTKMQMIFQDPFSSLNPRMTVRDIVSEPLVIHGMSKGSELDDKVSEILTQVGLKAEHRLRYPHAFSGGQRQRIGIARALIMHPELVVADEPVSALDVSVQAQVINLLARLQAEMGLTYIFIAHDLSVVRHIATRVAVMYAGRIVELSPTEELFKNPLHPYASALLAAVPNADPDIKMEATLCGEVADPGNLPSGCSFHPRCPKRFDRCDKERPLLHNCGNGRYSACHLCEK